VTDPLDGLTEAVDALVETVTWPFPTTGMVPPYDQEYE